MEWIRGETIGRGSFGTVSLAIPKTETSLIPVVVKSSEVSSSNSLRNEKKVLSELGNSHPNIVQMLGDSLTSEKGKEVYNLFLEYAGAGSLADQLRLSAGGKFEFSDAKRYARSILKGLDYIHQMGFVHCDIKLQNILLFNDGAAKIADFGLAKRVEEKTGFQLRGTPLYMSPEIVAGGEGESPADVWAFGCAVVEMVTGKPAWNCSPECDVSGLLYRIGVAGECPEIPGELCPEGKDFLRKCFVKDPTERWTAHMLLDHPFLSGFEDSVFKPASVSPRCPFEFPDWESSTEESSSGSDSIESLDSFEFPNESESEFSCWSSISSRFEEELVSNDQVMSDWSISDGWVSVR